MLTARLERLGLGAGARVLDLGCGEGRHVHGLAMLGGVRAVGVDIDGASLAKARAGLATLDSADPADFLEASAYALPFADDSFDAAICSEVLEHLDDWHAAVAEVARVLKPGGRFVATVPRAWPERVCWALAGGPGGYADQPGGHVRIFDAAALRRAIETAGFGYRAHHFAHALHAPYWWLKAAFWRRRDDHPAIRLYHRLLVWDLMERPAVTRIAERLLDPVMGKSVALYFERMA